jgi:hypothetical protein
LFAGQVLDVALIARGDVSSAVCQTPAQEVVGALAAFRGLAQLMSCLRSAVPFVAEVLDASATRCEVLVSRKT